MKLSTKYYLLAAVSAAIAIFSVCMALVQKPTTDETLIHQAKQKQTAKEVD